MSASGRCVDRDKSKGRARRWQSCTATPWPAAPRFAPPRSRTGESLPAGPALSALLLAGAGRLAGSGRVRRAPARSSREPRHRLRGRGLRLPGFRLPEAGRVCVRGAVQRGRALWTQAVQAAEPPPSLELVGVVARRNRSAYLLRGPAQRDVETKAAILTLPPGPRSHVCPAWCSQAKRSSGQRRAKRSSAPLSPSR